MTEQIRQIVSYADEDHDACLAVEDSSFWFKHRNDCIAALVNRYRPDGRFLDVGGGNGVVAKRLLSEGYDTTLLEPGVRGAHNARTVRKLSNVICATLDEANIPCESMGAVGAFDVVEHIKDDHGFVGRIADVLVPGGWFFATVPAHQWMWSAADDAAGHFRRYTEKSLRDVLGSRFDVAYSSYFFAPLLAPIFLLRAAPYRLGLKRSGGSEFEHGTTGRAGVAMISRLLAPEVGRIASGYKHRLGASLIVAAQRHP